MATKTDIKFRLKPRMIKDRRTGEKVTDPENALITMRVTYGTMRMEFSTGIHIIMECWDSWSEQAIGNSYGKTADEINKDLREHLRNAHNTIMLFEEKGAFPTQEEFKEAFKKVSADRKPDIISRRMLKPFEIRSVPDQGDTKRSKGDKKCSDESFNNLSQPKNKPVNTVTFWDVYHEYEAYAGKLNDWAEKTRKKYETIRYNLKSFRDWKRKHGLNNFEITFDYFDEDGFQNFVDYLRDVKKYVNTTIRKDIVMLKVVIRYAYRKRYHNNSMFEAYRPALKSAPRKVVFFNKKELEHLEKLEIPATKLYLVRTRDVFLFQCYTALSYCDMALLEPKDFQSNEEGVLYLRKNRKKTGVEFFIVLLPEAVAIARKYSFRLPILSNQRYNNYLKEIGAICKIDKPMHSHIGRHTAATYLLNRSIPMEMVAKTLGHSTTKQTRHYAKLLDRSVFEEFKKIMGRQSPKEERM
jgi:integrase